MAELKDVAPIPPEINKYLAILSKDPGSMVFAPLAEAYRKAGMLDEAIATAQDGLKLHPNYVSGMVALGRAYFEKGALAEAREALEKVLVIAPDNIVATNILEEIRQKPEELIELEELTELTEIEAEEEAGDFQVEEISFEAPEPGLGLAKDVQDIEAEKTAEDIGIWVEETESQLEEGAEVVEQAEVKVEVEEKEVRPRKEITTETIADLYIKQGYFEKAIDIYQTLYDADPENDEIKRKLDELTNQVKVKEEVEEKVKEQVKEEVEKQVEVGWAEPTGQEMPASLPQTTPKHEFVGAGFKPDPTVEAINEDSENINRLESWLKTIQSERRKG